MKTTITQQVINKLVPQDRQYEVWDNKLTGFLVRVNPTGKMNYVCQYQRNRKIVIAQVGAMTPAQAREQCMLILTQAARGEDPRKAKQGQQSNEKKLTLDEYLTKHYAPWQIAHSAKNGQEVIKRLNRCFSKAFGKKPLQDISRVMIERWRTQRLTAKISAVTVNTDIANLSPALNKAVEWGYLTTNPIKGLKKLKTDTYAPIERYLEIDEELRLRVALDQREEKKRRKRESGNQWRKARHLPLLPYLPTHQFVDDLKPMILLSINTGIRRNAIFHLRWTDINLKTNMITLNAATDKTSKKYCFPLNSEAQQLLKNWREQTADYNSEWVFPSPVTGRPRDNADKAWKGILKAANIEEFRWHDMRHHFASRLVMEGVDLNLVRELMGHKDIKMTLRYAHLSPKHQAEAVEKLVRT